MSNPTTGAAQPHLTENDIRPSHLMQDESKLHAQDVARFVQARDQFVVVPCPACQGNAYHQAVEKDGMDYVRCDSCGMMFQNPRPTPEFLGNYYATSENYRYWNQYIFPASEAKRREHIFQPRAQRTLDLCRKYGIPTGTLLEVGAGFGTYCEEIKALGIFERVIAVEPVPDLAEKCRQCGLEVIEAPIEQVVLQDTEIHVIALFEVLEHLFSPRDFMLKAAQLLVSGGLLIVTCPNLYGFELQTLWKKSTTLDVEHLNYFHPQSISRLAQDAGFEVLDILTPGKLDVDIVRKAAQSGQLNLEGQPFLQHLLLQADDTVRAAFQTFLAENQLSTHMWLVGRKK